jgi:hypothetical protein
MFSATHNHSGFIPHNCYHAKRFGKSGVRLVTPTPAFHVPVFLGLEFQIIPNGVLTEFVFRWSVNIEGNGRDGTLIAVLNEDLH